MLRELKKMQALSEEDLAKVVGGNEPSADEWTVCPKCGGTLIPYEFNNKEYEVYKCLSCYFLFEDVPNDPDGPGKIYL